MPVLARAADPVPEAAWWLSLCLRGLGATRLPIPHLLLCFPAALQERGSIAAGGLLEGVGERCGAHLAAALVWHLLMVAGRERQVKSKAGGAYSQLSLKFTENLLIA